GNLHPRIPVVGGRTGIANIGHESRLVAVTERIAKACAAHPWRTLAAWLMAVIASIALVATVMPGRLSTNGYVIGSPQSTVAQDTIEKYFPRIAYETKHDVVVVSSTRYSVKTPRFQAFGRALAQKINATGVVSEVKLVGVSPNGHAAVLSLLIHGDTDPKT